MHVKIANEFKFKRDFRRLVYLYTRQPKKKKRNCQKYNSHNRQI